MQLEKFKQAKANHERLHKIGLGIVIVAFIMFLPMGAAGGIGLAIMMQGLFVGGGILIAVNQAGFKKLSVRFKHEFLQETVKRTYPGSTYHPEHGFPKDDVYNSGLLRECDRYYSEDYLSGAYRDIAFESADVKLQNVHHNGKSTTVVTVFLGRFYRFEFPSNFATEMLIVQPSLGSGLGYGQYEKIQTESVEFNQEFKVYAADELSAFRILLPQFMEKLLVLDNVFKDKISLAFVKNVLYVAINNNVDWFDLKLNKPIDDKLFAGFQVELDTTKTILDLFSGESFRGYSHS